MESPVITADGSFTLRNQEYDECYHSTAGAVYEAQRLYIESSGFLQALDAGKNTAVLDIGLGLGYNALATIAAWWHATAPGNLHLCSLEIDRELYSELKGAKARWQDGWSAQWLDWARTEGEIQHPCGSKLIWQVVIGDARQSLDSRDVPLCHFVWHDPFSAKKLPELWTGACFRSIAAHCLPGATLMTYSVARPVRDALAEAGFTVERFNSGGAKKHWLRAKLT